MSSVPHCPSKSLAHRIHADPTRAEHAAYWGYECGKTRAGKVGRSGLEPLTSCVTPTMPGLAQSGFNWLNEAYHPLGQNDAVCSEPTNGRSGHPAGVRLRRR